MGGSGKYGYVITPCVNGYVMTVQEFDEGVAVGVHQYVYTTIAGTLQAIIDREGIGKAKQHVAS